MELILDVQGFHGNFNAFIVKELAVINTSESGYDKLESFLFAPPYAWGQLRSKYKGPNTWVARCYHGLHWDDGTTPYIELGFVIQSITKNASTIYVKGAEKEKWLAEYTDKPIVDLQDMECPKFADLFTSNCWHHHYEGQKGSRAYVCAVENVKRLKEWYLTSSYAPSLERSLNVFCNQGSLKDMAAQDIAFFPKHFIIKFAANYIEAIWDKLPQKLRSDQEIANCRRCYNHARDEHDDDRDEVASPTYPMIKNCSVCKNEKRT